LLIRKDFDLDLEMGILRLSRRASVINFYLLPASASLYLRRRTTATTAMLLRASTSQAAAGQIVLSRAIWRNFATSNNDLRSIAHAIKAPTLLLFGKHDPVIPADKDGASAAGSIHNSKLVVLPCGHVSFAEVPDLFLAEVEPFLAENIA
jgi:pimeloyl-ACP methyl ester carboxylesterase